MSNHHDEPSHVGPEREAAFQLHTEALAAHILASATHADAVRARLDAMQASVGLIARAAAREWNRTHDALLVLPLELREMCWSHLPLPDIVRLALVCSSWRDYSRSMPSLWTVLHVTRDTRDLDAILGLSRQLPFELSIRVVQPAALRYIDACLSRQAHRLCSLHIYEIRNHSDSTEWALYRLALFRYPAPVLEQLSLDIGGRIQMSFTDTLTFDKHAPALRSVRLSDCLFPTWCPAFGRVTELAITCRSGGFKSIMHIGQLFIVVPCLEKLELVNVSTAHGLPQIPPSSRLVAATISGYEFRFDHLVERGFLGLRSLTFRAEENVGILAAALEHHPASFHATLRIHANDDVAVELHSADGASARFIAQGVANSLVSELLGAPATAQRIHALVLPSGSRYGPVLMGDRAFIHLYLHGTRELPALRTLTLSFAPGPADRCSFFDRTLVRGTIVAPALARVIIAREHAGESGAGPALVNADQLCKFIRKHVVCDAPQALELFIDSDSGVVLGTEDGAIERLRASVGKLIV